MSLKVFLMPRWDHVRKLMRHCGQKLFLPAVLLALASSACLPAHLTPLPLFARKGYPNPLTGKTHFHVEAPVFSDTSVDGVALAVWQHTAGEARGWVDAADQGTREFLDELKTKRTFTSSKDYDQHRFMINDQWVHTPEWAEVESKLGEFGVSTGGSPGEDEVEIVPMVETIIPGWDGWIVNRPSSVVMHFLAYVHGALVEDVVAWADTLSTGSRRFSFRLRLGALMRFLADELLKYVAWPRYAETLQLTTPGILTLPDIPPRASGSSVEVTFHAAGLEWNRPNVHRVTLKEAHQYCSSLESSGRNWRLPTADELWALYDARATTPALGGDVRYYWVSDDMLIVSAVDGGAHLGLYENLFQTAFVRCVR